MSSATSIDRDLSVKAERTSTALPAGATDPPRQDAFKPWHFFVLTSLLAATVAIVVTRQARPEHLIVMSLTIGAAGFAAAALYRTLVPLLSSEPPPAAGPRPGMVRAGLEREKLLVLRAIKELEFDRAMGKVAAKDFDELAARLRARAMSLMRQLEADPGYRELIERELSARVTARGRSAPARAPRRSTPGTDAPPLGGAAAAPGHDVAPGPCACGTANDADASFCKRCGARLQPA